MRLSAFEPLEPCRAGAAAAVPDDCVGYHRSLLLASGCVLVLCMLLPAPNAAGRIELPVAGFELPELCMLQREYGIDCPGCGLTRCFLSMGHGQVAAAWCFHPVGALLFVAMAIQIPYRLCQLHRIRRNRPPLGHWTFNLFPWLLLAALLGQWLLRMSASFVP